MKKTLIVGLIIAIFLASFASASASTAIPFLYVEKTKQITLFIDNKEVTIASENFKYVMDWSDDYTRNNKGTAVLYDHKVIFQGAINSDQNLVFIYDLNTKKIETIEGVTKLIVDEKFGWAITKEYPKYSEAAESKDVTVIVNGKKILEINRDDLEDIKWDKNSGFVTMLIKSPQQN